MKKNNIITNNLQTLMHLDCAKRTLEKGQKISMREMDLIFAETFNYSTHSIMAIRQNKINVPIDKAVAFCEYFGIGIEEFFNIPKNKVEK